MLSSDIPIKTKEDQSNSIDENIKIKTLTTEHRETSTDDVKSFVIVNDINVEEEITKAQKDTQNFFQVLSMSFYGRMRSHSFDNQDSREVQKTPSTPQNEAKSALTRKRSAQTPSESKLSASKEMKPKTPGVLKKQALPTKELELIPEKSQKRLLSPKVDIGKMYSPVVSAGKKALVGNFTAKAAGKKETSGFVFDIQQPRPQTGKRSGEEGNRIGITADMIMSSSGRSTPMRVELPKKISLSKLGKTPKKVAVENIEEEKIVTISVDPSVLDIQDYQDGEDDKDRISCQDSTSKDGKVKKTTSRRGSDKNLKDKPATVTNNFVKGSATKSQPKINIKDGQDIHEFLLEQKKASTPLGVSSSNKEIKRGKKPVKKKANSQESNMDFSQDKLKNIVLSDLQDLGDDDEKAKTTKNDSGSKTVKKKSSVGKLDRQRSPDVVGKLYERIPTIMNNGIGDWGVKAAMITKYDLTRKAPQQKEMKEKEKEGTFFEMPGKKIDTMAPPASRELSKSKKSSMEKLGKGDKPSGQSTPAQSTQQLPTQPNQGQGKEGNNKEKKIESSSPGKDAYVRKLDNTTPKDEKSVKIGDIYLKKEKSTGSKEKGRTASPMSGEGRKQGGDILDKILIQKKKEKL